MQTRYWVGICAGMAGVFLGILAGFFWSLVHDLPEINSLKQYKPSAVTTVFAADNRVIGRFYFEKRFPVPLDQIPDHLINALITIEDRSFFFHSGINLKAIARAAIKDIRAGRLKEGASTITQQLAKTLFLTNEKSFVRKIKEVLLTLQIERRYTKNEILELYLNQIYLGAGAYGVEAASKTYFGKPVSDISLGQAALLAGLPKAPSAYSPKNNMALAVKRRNIVLFQMRQSNFINSVQYEVEKNKEIVLEKPTAGNRVSGYFRDHVRHIVQQRFDPQRMYTGGLNIHTTLDLDLQHKSVDVVDKHVDKLKIRMQKKGLDTSHLQCALVAMDVKTGAVLCMVGGTNYLQSEFNRAVQAKRQPGSAFKPFVYAAAVQQGLGQHHLLLDAPLSYRMDHGGTWEVKNFSKTYQGKMTLRKALALSKNTPAVRLMEQAGIENIIRLAQHSGIRSPLENNLSLALGTSEVNLLELTAAYIPFVNLGVCVEPFSIHKITDFDARLIHRHTVQKQSVLSRENAAVMADMLKAVIREGTGKKALIIKKDIGGKTGTTDEFKDALFIGFSPDTVLGVWVGNDDSSTLGKNETGAKAALPIWTDVMAYTMSVRGTHQYFDIPDGLKMVYMNPDTGRISKTKRPGFVKSLIKEGTDND